MNYTDTWKGQIIYLMQSVSYIRADSCFEIHALYVWPRPPLYSVFPFIFPPSVHLQFTVCVSTFLTLFCTPLHCLILIANKCQAIQSFHRWLFPSKCLCIPSGPQQSFGCPGATLGFIRREEGEGLHRRQQVGHSYVTLRAEYKWMSANRCITLTSLDRVILIRVVWFTNAEVQYTPGVVFSHTDNLFLPDFCRASTLSNAVSSLASTGMSFTKVDEREKQAALEEEQARLKALKVRNGTHIKNNFTHPRISRIFCSFLFGCVLLIIDCCFQANAWKVVCWLVGHSTCQSDGSFLSKRFLGLCFCKKEQRLKELSKRPSFATTDTSPVSTTAACISTAPAIDLFSTPSCSNGLAKQITSQYDISRNVSVWLKI